ncbi:HAD family hydrolase [Actinoplanes siamensis]|uniref:Phosphatase n=1 Tax=Actinoplanes siamensis TaxID=1223317 RepID=A0A919NCC3_9ACTN|nr:HAD family hydrolase [Actinoplanes siamensis]GIF08328.1 phosphatase [Actinoplanes siamensis]
MIRHIVWDWNGTVLGDSPALIAATIDAFRECGLPAVTRTDYQRRHVQPIPLFYERLAGRELSAAEQARLAECFRGAYAVHRETVTLTLDAVTALGRWTAAGRRQSLLSMYPHAELVPLVTAAGIAHCFARIDGSVGTDVAYKAPHLARHLAALELDPGEVLLVGDSVDDARAAAGCGVRCLVYHAGEDALHSREHFADLGVPLVGSLGEAVEVALYLS